MGARLRLILVVAIILVVVIALIIVGYRFDWTGFNGNNKSSKTLWDWLQLLAVLAIPVVVGLGAAWYTAQQGKVSDRENTDNQRENALQTYIDKISELLVKEHLGERTADGKLNPEYEHIRKIARVRTITVLTQLDGRRVGYVFTFLREAGLMKISDDSVLTLDGVDLHGVNWSRAYIKQVNLSNTFLYKANFTETLFSQVDLNYAYLVKANFRYASLDGVDLRDAVLTLADFTGADFTDTDLTGANLTGANLNKAKLIETTFDGANLSKAFVTPEQLKQAKSLKGATMPDGSINP